jgi:DNA polymerase-3 subunit alpha
MCSNRRFAKETAGAHQFEPVRPGKAGGVVTAAEFSCGSCDGAGMPLADFVHLRVHTAYSLSSGAIRIKELVDLCKAERMPAVAVTDTGNLFGALEVATTCATAGIQPIIGCGSPAQWCPTAWPGRGGRTESVVGAEQTGYRSLLNSSADPISQARPTEPAIMLPILLQPARVFCLTGGRAAPSGGSRRQAEAAEAALIQLAGCFRTGSMSS